LAKIAARQRGVVSRRQLVDLGLGRGAIQHRLDIGRLHRMHVGVYAVGHRAIAAPGRWMAAVLAYGPDAVLSHRSAAALWRIRDTSQAAIDVTVAGRTRARRPGLRLHLVRELHLHDRTRRDGIPVTSVPRTLLDLAETLRPDLLERAFAEADRRELLDLHAVEQLMRRSPGRHGLRPLAALLEHAYPAAPTRSDLEQTLLGVCREGGLPRPAVNVAVAGFEVDALWKAQRLVVEVDSWEFHRGRQAFENDRARDAVLLLAGYRVVRVTWRMLRDQPAEVAGMLRRLLAVRGGSGS
jgi:very-short-patch-repair endonuclease/predicted transcriptional regulator of viral defense system